MHWAKEMRSILHSISLPYEGTEMTGWCKAAITLTPSLETIESFWNSSRCYTISWLELGWSTLLEFSCTQFGKALKPWSLDANAISRQNKPDNEEMDLQYCKNLLMISAKDSGHHSHSFGALEEFHVHKTLWKSSKARKLWRLLIWSIQ
jgi:hypothetical protein